MAKDTLAAQVTILAAQVEQLQAAAAAQAEAVRASASLTTEKEALVARLAEVESRAANAQAEATRLGESLTALQRSTGQITGDALSNRALVQQLQGSNAVLAQENYQLKTMLSRSTGGPAAPTALPAARTHIVASGDSLSKISQRYYGTAGRWQEIYNANAGKLGPNGILRVGTELRIP
jgi:nucleoid-associated protein YgaU